MKKLAFAIVAVLAVVPALLLSTCGKNEPPPAASASGDDEECVTYAADVKPLLGKSCGGASCHGASGKGGDFSTYVKAKKSGARIAAVVAGKKHKGKIFSDPQAKVAKAWKAGGYPEKACTP